jgi:glyoxylase-like metal-dependent hydrolase (beta-lactamase superfamily II)
VERVAEGVHRLGSRWVNWYVVEDDGGLTIVDGGYPGYYDQLGPALSTIGRSIADVQAIVVTHAHADHLGALPRLQEASGARVLAHPADAPAIQSGTAKPPPSFFADAWRPRFARYLVHAARNGGRAIEPVRRVDTFADVDVLDVPGRPRVLHTPGHTAGHCAFLLEDRGVLFSGDALVTRDNVTGRTGAQPIRWNADEEEAAASYERLRETEARVVLPGHGEPWRRR